MYFWGCTKVNLHFTVQTAFMCLLIANGAGGGFTKHIVRRLAQNVFAQTHEVSNVYLNRLEVKYLNEALDLS